MSAGRAAPARPGRALLVLAPLLLSGCIATQRDVLDLSQHTEEVKAQVAEMKRALGVMQANQADLAVKFDQLQGSLGAFNENLRDNQAGMNKLSAKLDDLEAAIGRKVASIGDTVARREEAVVAAAQTAAERAAAAAVKRAEDDARAAAGPATSEPFRSAKAALDKKDFAPAAQGFQAYLAKHPKGEAADLATFYLGEARFGLKRWEDAARQYALLLDRHPGSDRVPSARLKYAICLINLKRGLPEARRFLESIPTDFPKSPEAARAKRLLRKLPTQPPPAAPR